MFHVEGNQYEITSILTGLNNDTYEIMRNKLVNVPYATEVGSQCIIGSSIMGTNEPGGLKIGYVKYQEFVSDSHTQQEYERILAEWS